MTFPERQPACLAGLALLLLTAFSAPPSWAGAPQGPSAIEEVVAVLHCGYPPVSSWDRGADRPAGFSVDVIDSIARSGGLQVNYICRNSWPEMISAIERGEADLAVLMKSAERERVMLFTVPIEMSYLSFFARAKSTVDEDSAPSGQTVGVVTGSMSHEQLKNRRGLKLAPEGTYQEGLFQLLAGKIDLFAGEDSMILRTAREAGLDDRIKKAGKSFVERERCLAVRRDNVRLHALLNRSLQGFVGSPGYQRIYLAWYGAPTPFWTAGRTLMTGGACALIVVFGMAFWRYRSMARINSDLVHQIAERKKAESDLELFKSLINRSNELIFVNDPQTGRFVDMNDRACSALGYSRDELLKMGVRDIEVKFPDDLIWRDHVADVKRRGFLLLEGMLRRKDGTAFPVETSVSYVALGAGEFMIAVVRDITERKQADAALRERERQLAESQRIAHIGSWEHNPVTGEIFWSDELFRLLGLDPAKDRADFGTFFSRIHPDDQPALKAAVEASLREKKPFDLEYRFVIPGEPVKFIHARAALVPDTDGKPSVLSGTGQDITERKLAEEKIRQSEEFIRGILDTVDEGFIVIGRDYRILTANKAYCAQVDLPAGEVIGRHCYELSHQSSRPCYEAGEECAVRQAFETGTPHAALHKHADHEGHTLFVETKAFPIKDASGAVTSVIETVNNITERHLLEEERLKTQKLESIGTLAGGIAHDFNNLLQGVFGYISMAKMMYDEKEKSLAMLEQAEQAVHQSVSLTSQLLTFSKGGKPVKKTIDLRPVIENAARFALSGSRSDIQFDIGPGFWHADADGGQLGQVIQNIVLNAEQAMPLGGKVTIAARNLPASEAASHPGLENRDHIMISIEDQGVGIPGHFLGKIFDPYFTTKEKGSGLGLATSYSIIRNHGGRIDVRSGPGTGSAFHIYLPAVRAEASPPAERPRLSAARLVRVLVMDDEEIIRKVARELLRILGHTVEFAEHGDEAIGKYKQAKEEGRPFDAVILDLTIRGGRGGAETLQALLELDPGVKAIVSSGYSDDQVTATYRQHGFSAFLRKPYDINELSKALNDARA